MVEQRPRPTPELERVRNRQRAGRWRGGGGAPVYLRADVAQALADLADRLLAEALGLGRGLPTAAPPPESGDGESEPAQDEDPAGERPPDGPDDALPAP